MIIWVSILGAAPFTLLLPHVGLFATVVLAVVIGVIISSAFSAILVYATDLVPGKVGLIAGLFLVLPLVWAAWGPQYWVGSRIIRVSRMCLVCVHIYH